MKALYILRKIIFMSHTKSCGVVFAYDPFCSLGGEVPSWTRIHPKGVLACFRAEIGKRFRGFPPTIAFVE
jgi:hypothetical protein